MISTNHVMAGAIIATAIKQPEIAIPVAFTSHFIMDALPHFGIAVEARNVGARNRKPLFQSVVRIDAVLTITAIVIVPLVLQEIVSWKLALICMIAALLPDLIWVYRFVREFKSGELLPKSPFSKFHSWIQWGERPWGWVIDLLWLCGSIATLYRLAI